MTKTRHIALDFEIDKLTRSIENTITGESCPTEILLATAEDIAQIKEAKTWQFDWGKEYRTPKRKTYKLTTIADPQTIQGLMSMEIEQNYIRMHLIESANFNIGKGKVFMGVLGNLVAFACKAAFDRKFNGAVAFYAKTKLIEHYKNALGAVHVGGHLMVLEGHASLSLVNKYFNQTSNA